MMLGEFLKAQASDRSPWNCSTLAADWCLALGHPDFAADWRHVTGIEQCGTAHVAPGELVKLWASGIGDSLPLVGEVSLGDIAVVEAAGFETGAIFTGGRWALQGTRGLHFLAPAQVRLVRAWRP